MLDYFYFSYIVFMFLANKICCCTLVIGSSLLWEMMLWWLSVSVILKNKAALDTEKGANLGLKCVKMRLPAGLRPGPLGELERSPRPPSRNWGRGAYF